MNVYWQLFDRKKKLRKFNLNLDKARKLKYLQEVGKTIWQIINKS